MSKIFIRGEKHFSSEASEKGKKLLEEKNIKSLIEEGSEHSYKINLYNFFYTILIHVFFCIRSLFNSPHEGLHELAREQGIVPQKTRKNDLKIYENSDHKILPLSLPLLFTVFFFEIIYLNFSSFLSLFGLLALFGLSFLFLTSSSICFVVPLRCLNFKSHNREIASLIKDEHSKHDKDTLVIVGNSHVDGIEKNLEENKGIRSENIDAKKIC